MSLYLLVSKWTLFMQIEAKSLHEQKSCTSSSKKLNLPFFYFCSSYCERQILQLISGLYESVFGIEAVGMCKILKNLLSVVFSMGFPSLLNSWSNSALLNCFNICLYTAVSSMNNENMVWPAYVARIVFYSRKKSSPLFSFIWAKFISSKSTSECVWYKEPV